MAEYDITLKSCELTPLLLSDNTEIKVPVSNRNILTNVGTVSTFTANSTLPQQNQCTSQFNHDDVLQNNKLIEHFHELPGDMFITQILSDSNSCEQTLENMRGL